MESGIRLGAVLKLIGKADVFADIGCDHGKLAAAAITSGAAKKCIAVDISAASLEKARKLSQKLGILDRMEFVEGDGFSKINTHVDVAVIAGMGGREIAKILNKPHSADRYILVPHQDASFLREYLNANGFSAKKDFVVKDGNYYDIIEAAAGNGNYSRPEIYFGKNYPPSDQFIPMLEERYTKLKAILDAIAAHNSGHVDKNLLEEWEEIKKWRE